MKRPESLGSALLILHLAACSHGGADDYRTPEYDPTPTGPSSRSESGCASASSLQADNKVVCAILNSLGNPADTSTYLRLAEEQRAFWNLNRTVQFAMIQECENGNAFALDSPPTLFMGVKLFANLKSSPTFLTSLQVILAHEWAHHVQYDNGFIVTGEPIRIRELEADAFAGFYMYAGTGYGSSMLDQVLGELHSYGDEDYNDPKHHGTPIERKYMGLFGTALAKRTLDSHSHLTYEEMHNLFRSEIIKKQTLKGFSQADIDSLPVVLPRSEDASVLRSIIRDEAQP